MYRNAFVTDSAIVALTSAEEGTPDDPLERSMSNIEKSMASPGKDASTVLSGVNPNNSGSNINSASL